MENAAEALKMAAGILIFVLALTLCISSFSLARETIDSIVTLKDRETTYTYLESNAREDRIVGVETVVPTMYKAYKENFEIHFKDTDGQESLVLYKYVDQNGNEIPMSIIDLEKENHANSERAIRRLNYILRGHAGDDYDRNVTSKEVTAITGGTSGLYEYLKNKKFEEKMGEYYQEDKESKSKSESNNEENNDEENPSEKLDINKSKKRVITYILQN